MKKLFQGSYIIRILLFLAQFYFVFIILDRILEVKNIGIIFLIIYCIFIVDNIIKLLSKKRRYINSIAYNIMQSGLYLYLITISIKINSLNVYVNSDNMTYFTTNFIILCFLLFFVMLYARLEFKNKKTIFN